MFSPLTKELIDRLQSLPGVGPKTAQRMAMQLLAKSGRAKGLALALSLQETLKAVGECKACRVFTEHELCELCDNPRRNRTQVCIVESAADLMAIEQTNRYRGIYFVLQGHLSPLDGIGPHEIGIPLLLERLANEAIEEIVIATNPTMEGKATAHYLAKEFAPFKIHCTRIAHGVPMGGEIEYLDGGTLALALEARLPMTD
jgi:recombination protein RecR